MGNVLSYSSCCVTPYRCNSFENLSSEDYEFLFTGSTVLKFKKHENIFKQGSIVSQVMFIEDGLAKIFLENDTSTLVLKIVPSCNFIGLSSINEDHSTHQYSARAYIDSSIRQFDISRFRTLIRQNAKFAKTIIDILNANSLQIYNRFFCFTYKQAYGRLADILLCLSNRIFKTDKFVLPLNRKELAELTGLSSETVIRLLRTLADEGIISIEGKSFKILNLDRLKEISDKG